jgi:hypothetical protein
VVRFIYILMVALGNDCDILVVIWSNLLGSVQWREGTLWRDQSNEYIESIRTRATIEQTD